MRTHLLSRIAKQQYSLVRHLRPRDWQIDESLSRQIERDFGFVPAPLLLHQASPELGAAAWMLLREVLLVGTVPRLFKESISLVVSSHNRCRFCEDSHAMVLTGLGSRELAAAIAKRAPEQIEDSALSEVVAWIQATLARGESPFPKPPLERGEISEMIGTAVFFSYLNRVIHVFLGDSPLPGPIGFRPWKRLLQITGAWMFRKQLEASLTPGESLIFLPSAALPEELGWASGSPHVAGAFARFNDALENGIQRFLSEGSRRVVVAQVRRWRGEQAEPGKAWLDHAISAGDLPPAEDSRCRLALLAAFVPYQVSERDIASVREGHEGGISEEGLLQIVAWASFQVGKMIGASLQEGDQDRAGGEE